MQLHLSTQIFPLSINVKAISKMSLPVVIGFVSMSVMRLIELFMVSLLNDVHATSALGLAAMMVTIITVIFMGMAQSLQHYIALASIRSSARQRISELLYISLIWATILCVIIGVGLSLGLQEVAGLLSEDIKIQEKFQGYFSVWILLGLLPAAIVQVFIFFFLGINQPKRLMMVLLPSIVANIFLNWIFIYGHFGVPAFGLVGVAYGSSLAGILETVICVMLSTQYIRWPFSREKFNRYMKTFAELAKHGLPLSFKLMLEPVFVIVVYRFAGQLGAAELALAHVATTFVIFTYLFYRGVGLCVQNKMSQSIARGHYREAQDWYHVAVYVMLIFSFWIMLLQNLAPQQLLSRFVADTAILDMGEPILSIVSIFLLLNILVFSTSFYLIAAKKSIIDLVFSVTINWFICIPFIWWAVSQNKSLPWIYMGLLVVEVGRVGLYLLARKYLVAAKETSTEVTIDTSDNL